MSESVDHRWAAAAALIALAAATVAWFLRTTVDDAFISFRYARNFVRGHGLVFNAGEPAVEGYTNFLWTLSLGLGNGLGIDLITRSHLMGIAAFLVLLATTWFLSRNMGLGASRRMVAVAVVATNASVITFATSGLETMAYAANVALLLTLTTAPKRAGTPALVLVSILGATVVMLRPDGGLALLVALGAVLVRDRNEGGISMPRVGALLVPGALLGAAWLGWKWSFYGSLLPHTFEIKKGGFAYLDTGIWFLAQFIHLYLLYLPIAVIAFRRRWMTDPGPLVQPEWPDAHRVLVAFLAAWGLYVVWIGGDYMGMRMLVPAIAPLVVLGVSATAASLTDRRIALALFALVLVANVRPLFMEMTSGQLPLRAQLNVPGRTSDLGKRIESAFGDLPRADKPRIAVTAAGAIPFYADVPTYDMLGLSTPHVVQTGKEMANWPGHRWIGMPGPMIEHGVRFMFPTSSTVADSRVADPFPIDETPFAGYDVRLLKKHGTQLLFFPADRGESGIALYVQPDPDTTRRLLDAGFRTATIAY